MEWIEQSSYPLAACLCRRFGLVWFSFQDQIKNNYNTSMNLKLYFKFTTIMVHLGLIY